MRQDPQQTLRFSPNDRRRIGQASAEVKEALVGSLVLNRFLIERRIGNGGFGTVYEAWDGRLERSVAVKAIESGGAQSGSRVLREAQAAARLSHRGIVTLYEMGEEDGNALLVSELVQGATLDSLSREGELSDREVAEIGADLCEALDYAHSRGVVHRDIKPQNVLVTDTGEPHAKLMDFGVARLTDATALTAPGDVVGTLAYMAPEQAEGRTAGPEADVYSLALTLYECWSGENPNRRPSPAATARAIGRRPRALRRLRPDLPRELSDTIDACLAPRPARRPGLEELGPVLEDSLEQLADHPRRGGGRLRLRLGVAAATAALGAWLALGHGVALP
jgi:serine/threonine protein kinase